MPGTYVWKSASLGSRPPLARVRGRSHSKGLKVSWAQDFTWARSVLTRVTSIVSRLTLSAVVLELVISLGILGVHLPQDATPGGGSFASACAGTMRSGQCPDGEGFLALTAAIAHGPSTDNVTAVSAMASGAGGETFLRRRSQADGTGLPASDAMSGIGAGARGPANLPVRRGVVVATAALSLGGSASGSGGAAMLLLVCFVAAFCFSNSSRRDHLRGLANFCSRPPGRPG